MKVTRPIYSKEEFARRGDRIYDQEVRPHVKPEDEGKYVVIDIESGAYELDADELAASDRLLTRYPDAQAWLTRVGHRHARHLGTRTNKSHDD